MAEQIAKQSEAAIWLQQDGTFTAAAPFQRGQAGLGDITLPGPGDRTVFFGTSAFGNPVPLGAERAAPASPTTTIENYVTFFRDVVQKMRELGQCRNVQLRIHDCISLDHPGGWAIIVHLGDGQTGDSTITAPVSREFGDARIAQAHPFNPTYDVVWVAQALTRLTTSETNAANGVVFLSDLVGCSNCGNGYSGPDQIGYIACDAVGAGTANVLSTTDGGSTWAATSADPFIADEHMDFPLVRFLNKTQLRLVVSRITTDAGNNAEIAYADVTLNGGEATTVWTQVDVGSNVGDVITAAHWPEFGRMYIATDNNTIHLSTDQGETFTTINTGAQPINAFASAPNGNVYAVGDANTILVEKGKSSTFEALVGPTGANASLAVAVANDGTIWLGNGTAIFYTENDLPSLAGNWTSSKDFAANHAVIKIDVKGGEKAMGGDSQLVHACVNDGTANDGDVWLTADGGAFWQEITDLSNSEYNDAYFSPVDPNLAFLVGEVDSATALIHKLAPGGGV